MLHVNTRRARRDIARYHARNRANLLGAILTGIAGALICATVIYAVSLPPYNCAGLSHATQCALCPPHATTIAGRSCR